MYTHSDASAERPVILTGDRTTGPLHLGHYVGSLRNRLALQHSHRQHLLLADAQALTDNAHDPAKVRRNVLEVATDYLAVGIDPDVTTICVQSALPALAELTMLYLNFVTVARLERNPTIKDEIQARGFGATSRQGSCATRQRKQPTLQRPRQPWCQLAKTRHRSSSKRTRSSAVSTSKLVVICCPKRVP